MLLTCSKMLLVFLKPVSYKKLKASYDLTRSVVQNLSVCFLVGQWNPGPLHSLCVQCVCVCVCRVSVCACMYVFIWSPEVEVKNYNLSSALCFMIRCLNQTQSSQNTAIFAGSVCSRNPHICISEVLITVRSQWLPSFCLYVTVAPNSHPQVLELAVHLP